MKLLSEIKIEETFSVAGIEFIKFSEKDGVTVAVAKDCVFKSQFGANNNFSESKILKRLSDEILPKIEEVVGAENVLEFETDLLSLDGSNKYGKIKSKISIPTFDFYRQNVKVFNKYKLDCWWWTATPDSTTEHFNNEWCVCVSPYGNLNRNDYYNFINGVRPFFHFVSSISVSCDE